MAIVKMKKVSLVVLDSTRKESLETLRKMGVVHLEEVEGQGEVLASYKESSTQTEKAISILEEIKLPKKQPVTQVNLELEECKVLAKKIVDLVDSKKSLYDRINQDTQELERLSPWGRVEPEEILGLQDKGIFLYMYEIPEDKYSLIGEDVKTIVVNTCNKVTRFVHVAESEVYDRPVGIPAEAYAVPLPQLSTKELEDDIVKAERDISLIEHEIISDKKYTNALKAYKKSLNSDIEFETVFSGMGRDENTDSVKLAWITGYIPVDKSKFFVAECKKNAWAFTMDDPADDDPVPTKLKNNKLVSLIYPLTDFLDVTPGYHEFDISGWFLLFFCIFFGMIFGDAGYGCIITVAALFLMLKSAFSGKKVQPVFGLMLMLGFCTMAYGAFTCSWFGIDINKLPQWMRDISLAPISKAKSPLEADTNQKILCFSLALVQLSIAHIMLFGRDIKSLKCLADFGDLIKLWGMFYVVMNMVVDAEKYPLMGSTAEGIPVGPIAIGCVVVGFILSFIFSNYEGNVGKSVLESCKNIISVLLGVVNVFSDIVSYIRLWAVALAGAAISETVNSMAGPMLGKFALFIFGVILLVFGHGLNNILNLLSVIVHGVRLNTLEFSQHAGLTWSGTKYRPFSEE